MGTLNTAVGTPATGVGGGGGGGGTSDHTALTNRSASNQHPQSAITNLVTDLAAIVSSVSAAITTAQARGGHTGTQLAATISDFAAAANALIAGAAATGTGNLVRASAPVLTGATAAADPTAPLGLATKQFVEGIATNLGKRQRVRAASTANINLAAPGAAIDGVTMVAGDLFMPKDQTTGGQNGVYSWNGAAVAATRAPEFDTYDEHPGSLIVVQEGTVNADTMWLCTSNVGGTLGSTALTFSANSAPTTAASVSISDAGGYWTGTNTETVLQEAGAALALRAPAANPTLTGNVTLADGLTVTSAAMGANAVDVTQLRNTKTLTADVTLTFSATPGDGVEWGIELTGDTVPRTVTIPSSRNVVTQEDITTLVVPANSLVVLAWRRKGSVNMLSGVPGMKVVIPFAIEAVADGDYPLLIASPYAGVVTRVTTDCDSGTCTLTGKVNTTNLGGTANSVSTTQTSQTHSASNAVAVGDRIVASISANSSCLRLVGTVELTVF